MKFNPIMLILFLNFILISFGIKAQDNNQRTIDSLNNILKQTIPDSTRIKALVLLSYSYENTEIEKAFELTQKALKLAIDANDTINIIITYNLLGNLNQKKSQYENALACYEKALALNEFKKDTFLFANLYNNIGIIYDNIGNYDKAIEYLIKSTNIYEKLNDKIELGRAYNNIGLSYYRQENYEKALEYYKESLRVKEKSGDKGGVALEYNNMGIVYYYLNEPDKVLEYFKLALKIYEELGDKRQMALPLFNIGQIYDEQGDTKEALRYLEKSLALDEELGDKKEMAGTMDFIGRLYCKEKNFEKALEYQKKAIDIAKEIGALFELKDACEGIFETYNTMGNYHEALKYHILFKNYNDSIFSTAKFNQIAELQTKFDTEKKEKEIQIKNLELESQISKNEKQQTIIYSFILGVIIILVFSAFLYRMFLQKKKANILITEKNVLLEQANEEINAQKEEIESQRDKIIIQKEIVEKQKEHIESSINYAQYIQQAILPSKRFMDENLNEYFILYKPRNIVSGDFYWTTKIKNWLIVTVADCTGHGVPGAFMSMLGISFLNEIVRKEEVTDAGKVLDILRENVIETLKQKETEFDDNGMHDGLDIALCAINTSTNHCQFAGANNPLYMIRRIEDFRLQDFESQSSNLPILESSNSALVELKGDVMPISIYSKMQPFQNHDIHLQKGDIIYLFSDGFADQFGGPKGKKFMYKNLKDLLLKNSQLPMNEQKNILEKTIHDWIGENEQVDDITILGMKCN